MSEVIKFGKENKNAKGHFAEDGTRTFYVRFYNDQEKKDFLEALHGLQKKNPSLLDQEMNGCYKVWCTGIPRECTHSVWDMLWHLCLGMANGMMDKASNLTYYPCIVSNSYIKPTAIPNKKIG